MSMHDQFPRWPVRLVVVLLLAVLAACAPLQEERERHPAVDRAEQALADGEPGAAAAAFLEAAEAEDPPLQQEYTLRAAATLVDADRLERGERLARQVAVDEDTPAAIIDFRSVVLARVALAQGDYETALERVDRRLPSNTRRAADLLETRADAEYRLGRLLASAETRASLEALLPEGDRLDRNREQLRDTLAEVPMEQLRERMPPALDVYGGWIELTFLVRNYRLDPERMEEAVAQWRDRYPDHPAAGRIAEDIMESYRTQVLDPERITLLLPLSGNRAEAARAVRNGFLAARLVDEDRAPEVRVRDIGEDGEDPWAAYMQAVQAGTDLVVGPLTRPAVDVFAESSTLPVPMLALNRSSREDEIPGNLFRFGLLPEHEARQAATHALASGHRRAAVLHPANDWGERIGDAFTESYDAEGGTVVARERYREDQTDFSLPIRRMLALEASSERASRLRGTINRSFEFEPRRRQDVDVVFVAAFPRQARLIRPQLRFHHALDLPVMATSHAWQGRDDVAESRDMAGVVFFDMPWMLGEGDALQPTRSRLAGVWDDVDQHAPLYALGIDAYRLIPYLATLRNNQGERLEGATGLLRINGSGHVHREVLPARFHQGEVERLQPSGEREQLPGLEDAAAESDDAASD